MVVSFLERVESFIARHGMSPSAFGMAAVNDSGFFFDLQRGRSPRLNTCERIDAWMREEDARRSRSRRRRRVQGDSV